MRSRQKFSAFRVTFIALSRDFHPKFVLSCPALVARRVRTGVAAVVTALILAGSADTAGDATLRSAESSLLAVMNQVRIAHGLRPLRADMRLESAARAHSRRMLRTGTFAHGAFNTRIRRAGVRAPRIGENLAWSAGSLSRARTIVQMWLASPAHRANLLRPGYRIVGVGAINGRFNGQRRALMVTTDFAGR
jgi:uncharacterized protein YkwD